MVNQDQLKHVEQRIEAINNYLKINEKKMRLKEEELKTQDPSFWDDPKEAEKQMKVIRSLKFWVEASNKLQSSYDDLTVLFEFVKEGVSEEEELDEQFNELVKEIEEIELKNMLSGEEDPLSAVLQITAGAGGTEACDWAEMLMRMYIMWAEKSGYKVKELNFQEGDVAGVKTVTLEIEGEYAFGYLKVYADFNRTELIHSFEYGTKVKGIWGEKSQVEVTKVDKYGEYNIIFDLQKKEVLSTTRKTDF